MMATRMPVFTASRLLRRAMRVAFLATLGGILACRQTPAVETVHVSLKPGEVFEYPTVGGDEDGARIVVQPRHAALSEIRRNEQTSWIAVYVYQPADGFTGFDSSEIEILTGSDGASPPKQVTRVSFRFDVR